MISMIPDFLFLWFFPKAALAAFFLVPLAFELWDQNSNGFGYSTGYRRWARRLLLPLVNFETTGQKSKDPALYCIHPHGPLALGQFLGFMISKQKCVALVSEELLLAPILSCVLMGLGARVVSKETIEKALAQNYSAVMIPGGVREMGLAQMDTPTHYNVLKRRNFLDVAKELKCPVVPCLMLGESAAYTFYIAGWLSALQSHCYAWLGWWGPIIVWGRNYSILPKHSAKMKLCILEPMFITQEDDITTYANALLNCGKTNGIEIIVT